jgi:hypothetical protein
LSMVNLRTTKVMASCDECHACEFAEAIALCDHGVMRL